MNTGGIIKPKLMLTINYGDNDGRLKIFLCHALEDKLLVRNIYELLKNANFIPWLDEHNIMPGEEWTKIISSEISNSNVILIFLSSNSISKIGYIQKEIKYALEVAELQPEGKIFIIPIKLNECQIPQKLSNFQYLDYFNPNAKDRLMNTLNFIQANVSKHNNSSSNQTEQIDLFLGFIDDLNIVLEKSLFRNVLLIVQSAESGRGEMNAYRYFLDHIYPFLAKPILEDGLYLAFANKQNNIFASSLVGNQLKKEFNISSKGVYYISKGKLADFKQSGFLDDDTDTFEKIGQINFKGF